MCALRNYVVKAGKTLRSGGKLLDPRSMHKRALIATPTTALRAPSADAPSYGLRQSWDQALPTMSAIWSNSENIYSLRVLPPVTRIGHRYCVHQGGSISPLMIFTTCDASANSVAAIAKVTLTRLSLGRTKAFRSCTAAGALVRPTAGARAATLRCLLSVCSS
jgi:hypothetical protein